MAPDGGKALVFALLFGAPACAAHPPPGTGQPIRPVAPLPAAPLPRVTTSFAYHYDRNALVASVRTDASDLLALTDSGNLLLFDGETFSLKRERVPSTPAVCLGPMGSGGAVVGLADGRIVQVDVRSLRMKPIGQVEGEPIWIGRAPSDALLVVRGLSPEKPSGSRARSVASLTVEELGSGRKLRLPFVGQAFLADRTGRLWIGADHGEWGGRLAVADLRKWSVREIESKGDWQGIYGFTETPQGHVWAYGGTIHLGGRGSFLKAVDREPAATLYEMPFAQEPPPDRPSLPITHVVALGEGRAFLVFAYDQIFEVDAGLRNWKQLPKLEAHYKPGRPDAVGSYPAVKAVHLITESPRRLALATALDGWVELRGDTFVPHKLAGQLGSSNVRAFDDWAGRIVAWSGDFYATRAWELGPNGWSEIEARSPVPLPETERSKQRPAAAFLIRSSGDLLTAFRDEPRGWDSNSNSPALLVTARCQSGRCDVIDQEQSLVDPRNMFVTPDDTAWAINGVGLWRFQDKRWTLVRPRGRRNGPLPDTSRILGAAAANGPPWVLHDRTQVLILDPGTASSSPRLKVAVQAAPPGESSHPLDVASCAGRVYVARHGRLCKLDVGTGACLNVPLSDSISVDHVGCDRNGRLWIGGNGLWTVEGSTATAVRDFDALSGGREVRALGRDTGAGLPVAIEERGVAVLFARGPAAEGGAPEPDAGDQTWTPKPRQAVFLLSPTDHGMNLFEPLDEALSRANVGEFGGFVSQDDSNDYRGQPVFYGPNAEKMVEVMRTVIVRLGKEVTLIRRDGERGAPEERIEIARPAAAAARPK